jgi:plasmid stability protein
VTIRRLPDDLLARIKAAAAAHGRSLEQELRESLAARYPTRDAVLVAIRERWAGLPEVSPDDIDSWVEAGRDETGGIDRA